MTSEAQKKAMKKYDQSIWKATIRLTRQQETEIREAAKAAGMSVNQYMVDAINEKLKTALN